VREWAIQNAELWVREYGIDGLRLDAVPQVSDDSDPHVMVELPRGCVRTTGRLVISEVGSPDFRSLRDGSTTRCGWTGFTTRCTSR
jgi:glycosidase